ncbi:Cyanate permease [Halopseudomonas xinjiangensis]|uniref:Cyanate permease n=1 Tax=Halopseudomonas xinjiangensis TaxID=487184 RepID=A0A1H1P9C1_9GAMM|nr:MFS transporter [Halopseudomonas xinjiangensis]SDS07753.1 Cyanate permease [Halopseudomonas xinjiangensis]
MSQSNNRPNMVITVLCGTLTSLVVIGFARLAYGVILPAMRADLGLSYQQAGILSTVTALCYVCFVLAGGLAAARWGAKASILFGMLTVTVGFVGLAFAANFWLVMFLKGVLGFGTAFAFAPMVSLLATWFPEKRGLVIGCMTSGVGLGVLVSGVLVPAMFSAFGEHGWRVSWGVFAGAALFVAAMIALFVRNPPQAKSSDAGGLPSDEKWRIYRNPRVLIVASTYGIIGMGYIVQTVFMVSYMVETGHSASTAGSFMAMMGLMSIAAGPLWGWVSDFWGRGNALAMCIFMVIVAMGLPLIDQTLLFFFLHFLVMGASINGLFAMIQTSATDQVAPRYIPIAFSFATLFFAIGQFLGPAIAGWLIESTGGFTAAFSFTFLVLSVGFGLTLLIRRFPKELAVAEPEAVPTQQT